MSEYEMLKSLLIKHFYLESPGVLGWGWREDITLEEVDPILNSHLVLFLGKVLSSGEVDV